MTPHIPFISGLPPCLLRGARCAVARSAVLPLKSCQVPIQPWNSHGALSIKMANYCFLLVSLSQEAQLSFQSTGFLSSVYSVSTLALFQGFLVPFLSGSFLGFITEWGRKEKRGKEGGGKGPVSIQELEREKKVDLSGAGGQGHFLM